MLLELASLLELAALLLAPSLLELEASSSPGASLPGKSAKFPLLSLNVRA
jgi:hypothetical protein